MNEDLYSVLDGINVNIMKHKNENLILESIIDSFDIAEIVVELEAAFGITFDLEEIIPENFSYVSSIEELVNSKLNKL